MKCPTNVKKNCPTLFNSAGAKIHWYISCTHNFEPILLNLLKIRHMCVSLISSTNSGKGLMAVERFIPSFSAIAFHKTPNCPGNGLRCSEYLYVLFTWFHLPWSTMTLKWPWKALLDFPHGGICWDQWPQSRGKFPLKNGETCIYECHIIYIYICIYICVYIYICVCIYIYICIYWHCPYLSISFNKCLYIFIYNNEI